MKFTNFSKKTLNIQKIPNYILPNFLTFLAINLIQFANQSVFIDLFQIQ